MKNSKSKCKPARKTEPVEGYTRVRNNKKIKVKPYKRKLEILLNVNKVIKKE